jgi:hypothetical protein
MFLLFLNFSSHPTIFTELFISDFFLLPFFTYDSLLPLPYPPAHSSRLLKLNFFLMDPASSNSPRGLKLLFTLRDLELLALIFTL